MSILRCMKVKVKVRTSIEMSEKSASYTILGDVVSYGMRRAIRKEV